METPVISLRLPDELRVKIDGDVKSGKFKDRSDAILSAIKSQYELGRSSK